MSDAATRLQAALRTQLAADSTLQGLLGGAGRIHDAPPRNAPMPYLAVDAIATTDAGGVEVALEDHAVTLSAWSRAGGKREAMAIADRAAAILAANAPSLAGHRVAALRFERRETGHGRDRVTAFATLRLRILTEPA